METNTKTNSGISTTALVTAALFVALAFIGSYIKVFGTIAFDSLAGFLSALLLGPGYGAAIGFLGHMLTALTSGFPLSLPLHIVVALAMALTMFGYGSAYKMLVKRASKPVSLAVSGVVGVVLNGPVSLAMSIGAMTIMAGREAGLAMLAMLPALWAAAAANVVLSIVLFKLTEGIWNKMK
jgi:uncharacterized membrane protein